MPVSRYNRATYRADKTDVVRRLVQTTEGFGGWKELDDPSIRKQVHRYVSSL